MISLATTTQRIRVWLNAAHTTTALKCLATYADETSTTHAPGSNWVATNGTTPVEIVAAPAASTNRLVKYLSVYNSDTANKTVTIDAYDGTTSFVLFSATIAPGEKIEFGAEGFRTLTAAGALKTIATSTNVAVSSSWSILTLSSNVVNASGTANTLASISGLEFAVAADTTYAFRFVIGYTAAAATTGSRWVLTGPTTSLFAYQSTYATSAVAITTNFQGGYQLPSASSAGSASGVNAGNIATIEGFVRPNVSGTLTPQFASEISGSAITALAGSYVQYMATL